MSAKHGMSAEIVWRNHDNTQQTWEVKCSCRSSWRADSYESAEDEWREHYYGIKGIVPPAMGYTNRDRWAPVLTAEVDR